MKVTTHDLIAMMEAWLADHPRAPRRITEHIRMDIKILELNKSAIRSRHLCDEYHPTPSTDTDE